MKNAFLFPGQGSQTVGMAKDLYENSEQARNIIDKANEVLGFDLRKLMFEGPIEELTSTENTQPALMTASYTFFQELKSKGISPEVCLGHSLGEVTGIICAGYFSFEDGLQIVRKRGQLMKNSDPDGKGGMAAVIGLEPDAIREVIATLGGEHYAICANYNSPEQTVISGNKETIEALVPLLKEKGAKRALPLPVSGPFHTKLMEKASADFSTFLEKFNITDTDIKVISNYTTELYTKDNLKENLTAQIINPVRFVDCVNTLSKFNINRGYEVGPGKVLSGLIRRINPELEMININSAESLASMQG